MATAKRYGIKFPFTDNNDKGYFIDLNEVYKDKIASEILHVLLTPVKTRIHMPDFGTSLSKYIFEHNDETTWDNVKNEAINAVSKYVSNVNLSDVQVYVNDGDDYGVFLDLKYEVTLGNTVENNELGIKLI